VMGRAEKTALVDALTAPPPVARSPFQDASAFRTWGMVVLLGLGFVPRVLICSSSHRRARELDRETRCASPYLGEQRRLAYFTGRL